MTTSTKLPTNALEACRVIAAATFRDMTTAIAEVEAALADQPYLLGARYSAADLLIAGAFAFFRQMIPGTGPIEAWVGRCQDRDSVRRAGTEDAEWMARMSSSA